MSHALFNTGAYSREYREQRGLPEHSPGAIRRQIGNTHKVAKVRSTSFPRTPSSSLTSCFQAQLSSKKSPGQGKMKISDEMQDLLVNLANTAVLGGGGRADAAVPQGGRRHSSVGGRVDGGPQEEGAQMDWNSGAMSRKRPTTVATPDDSSSSDSSGGVEVRDIMTPQGDTVQPMEQSQLSPQTITQARLAYLELQNKNVRVPHFQIIASDSSELSQTERSSDSDPVPPVSQSFPSAGRPVLAPPKPMMTGHQATGGYSFGSSGASAHIPFQAEVAVQQQQPQQFTQQQHQQQQPQKQQPQRQQQQQQQWQQPPQQQQQQQQQQESRKKVQAEVVTGVLHPHQVRRLQQAQAQVQAEVEVHQRPHPQQRPQRKMVPEDFVRGCNMEPRMVLETEKQAAERERREMQQQLLHKVHQKPRQENPPPEDPLLQVDPAEEARAQEQLLRIQQQPVVPMPGPQGAEPGSIDEWAQNTNVYYQRQLEAALTAQNLHFAQILQKQKEDIATKTKAEVEAHFNKQLAEERQHMTEAVQMETSLRVQEVQHLTQQQQQERVHFDQLRQDQLNDQAHKEEEDRRIAVQNAVLDVVRHKDDKIKAKEEAIQQLKQQLHQLRRSPLPPVRPPRTSTRSPRSIYYKPRPVINADNIQKHLATITPQVTSNNMISEMAAIYAPSPPTSPRPPPPGHDIADLLHRADFRHQADESHSEPEEYDENDSDYEDCDSDEHEDCATEDHEDCASGEEQDNRYEGDHSQRNIRPSQQREESESMHLRYTPASPEHTPPQFREGEADEMDDVTPPEGQIFCPSLNTLVVTATRTNTVPKTYVSSGPIVNKQAKVPPRALSRARSQSRHRSTYLASNDDTRRRHHTINTRSYSPDDLPLYRPQDTDAFHKVSSSNFERLLRRNKGDDDDSSSDDDEPGRHGRSRSISPIQPRRKLKARSTESQPHPETQPPPPGKYDPDGGGSSSDPSTFSERSEFLPHIPPGDDEREKAKRLIARTAAYAFLPISKYRDKLLPNVQGFTYTNLKGAQHDNHVVAHSTRNSLISWVKDFNPFPPHIARQSKLARHHLMDVISYMKDKGRTLKAAIDRHTSRIPKLEVPRDLKRACGCPTQSRRHGTHMW